MKTGTLMRALPVLLLLTLPAGQAMAVEPIPNSSGRYLSPYTSDGVFAEWVNRTVDGRTGAAVGGAVGAYAGQRAMESVPFVGGFLGSQAGAAAGRRVAMEAAGGESFMRESSDLSFNSLDDMAQWMYLTHSDHPHYEDALKAAQDVYPELKQIYPRAASRARAEQQRRATAGGIGAGLAMEAGLLTVKQLMEGSPAANSGLRENDVIIRIDGEMVRDEALQGLVNRIRGEVGTEVTVSVLRDNQDRVESYTMRRERITTPEPQRPLPQTAETTRQPSAPPAPPVRYADRGHLMSLALGATSGDLSGMGLGLDVRGRTAAPEAGSLGWFYDYGLFISSGDSVTDEVDFFEMQFAGGASVSVSSTVRLYGGPALDMISIDGMDGDPDYMGLGWRLGSQVRFPDQNLIFDLGVRNVDAEDDSFDGAAEDLSYTGLRGVLEYGFTADVGGYVAYEERNDDSTLYFGIGGRF